MSEQPICEAYSAIAEMGLSLGVRRLCDMEGCWEHQINDEYWVAANGHKEPVKCSTGAKVPGFHFYVMRNGWPAALLGPGGGTVLASWDGEETLEDAIIDAVQAATVQGLPRAPA
jgi:hypothetical protein